MLKLFYLVISRFRNLLTRQNENWRNERWENLVSPFKYVQLNNISRLNATDEYTHKTIQTSFEYNRSMQVRYLHTSVLIKTPEKHGKRLNCT